MADIWRLVFANRHCRRCHVANVALDEISEDPVRSEAVVAIHGHLVGDFEDFANGGALAESSNQVPSRVSDLG